MSRVTVAERTRLSVFLARGMVRRLATSLTGFPLTRLSFFPGKTERLVISPQDLRTSDTTRATEIYAGRFVFAGKVVVCDARSRVRNAAALRRLGRRAQRFRLAAPFARSRFRHHARQCARAGRRVDHAQELQRPDRLAARGGGAAHHVLADAVHAGARQFGRALLSPFPAQPHPAGPPSAPHRVGGARRRAAAAVA